MKMKKTSAAKHLKFHSQKLDGDDDQDEGDSPDMSKDQRTRE